MWTSKRYNKMRWALVWSAIALLMTSCWGPRKKTKEEVAEATGASFYVYKANGVTRDTKKDISTKWQVPQSKDYSFSACVKNSQTEQPIRHQQFNVKKGTLTFESEKTDENGCFTWVENLPFNYFAANPRYVFEERFVQSKGKHSGQQLIRFALNPWLSYRGGSRGEEVIYLNEESASEEAMNNLATEKELMGKNSEQVDLWMNDVVAHVRMLGETVTTSSDPNDLDSTGVDIEINLKMKPVIKLYDEAGAPFPIDLKAGEFKVEAILIATNFDKTRSKKIILTPELTPENGAIHWSDGFLRVPIKSRISRKVSIGQIELALRVIPINSPSNVNISNFDGLYLLVNNFDKIDGKSSPTLRPSVYRQGGDFNFLEYVKKADNFKKFYESRQALKNDPFIFKTLDVRFQTIMPGETATTRTVLFRVKTCVLNSFGSPVQNEEFDIQIIRNSELNSKELMKQPEVKEPIKKYTDEEGCLTWMDAIIHKYYKPEEYVFPQAIITNFSQKQRAEKIGKVPFSKKLTMVVNPWDEKWTFGADRRALLDDYVKSIKTRKKVVSRFFVYEYNYQTIRFLYEIDRFMNLEVKKTVLMKIAPKVLRYSSIVYGRRATETLRDGIYLMKVALQKDYLDPASKGVQIVKQKDGRHVYLPANISQRVKEEESDDSAIYTTKYGAKIKTREHISVVQKLVRVQDGQIITPVTFSIRDLRLMKIRSQFLVQLETIDEHKLLESNVFNKMVDEKINNFVDNLEDGHLSAEEQSQCLMQNTSLFQQQLSTVVDEITNQRGEIAKGITVEERKRIKEKLLSHKKYLLNQLVRNLNSNPTNRRSYSDDKSALLSAQEKLKKEGKSLSTLLDINDFYTPINMCPDIYLETLKSLELNDFTVNPAAPIVNLNLLIDHDSGLAKRTFVGPLTLIHNSNHSNMRATDNLDETHCESDDCNQLDFTRKKDVDNSEYEDSELFGSIQHLVDKSVDDLIKRKLEMVKVYKKEMTVESLLYNLMKFKKMRYVTLSDDPEKKLKKYTCGPLTRERLINLNLESECLDTTDEFSISKNEFIDMLNKSNRDRPVNEDNLREFVEQRNISQELGEGLCRVLADEFVNINNEQLRKRPHVVGYSLKIIKEHMQNKCTRNLFDSDGSSLTVNGKYRVSRTGRYRFKGGKSLNLNVGDAFTASHNSTFGFSGTLRGGAGVGTKNGILSGKVDMGWNRSEQKAVSDNTSVSKATFLVMQTAALDVELLRYEKCVTVKWSPEFVDDNRYFSSLYKNLRREESDISKQDTIYQPGLFICTGEVEEDKPVGVRERYYYFTQHFTDGDMLDPGDLYNHPWLLFLRGVRDFRAFVDLSNKQNTAMPLSDNPGNLIENPFASNKIQNSYKWPIDQLSRTYKAILPSFPGIYTVVEEDQEQADYPWYSGPEESFNGSTFKNSWDLVPVEQ